MQMLTSNIYGIWSHLDLHNTDACRILKVIAILAILLVLNAHALVAGQLPHYCCHRSLQVVIIIITTMVTTMVTKNILNLELSTFTLL